MSMQTRPRGWHRPAALAFVAVLLVGARPASAAPAISVLVDGKPLVFTGAVPTRLNGRTMVPMRRIFEALDATIKWDAPTQSITATRGATVVQMAINSPKAVLSGREVTLDQPPVLLDGSTMVPLRFVGEALGAQVSWNETLQQVSITSPPAVPKVPLPVKIDDVAVDTAKAYKVGDLVAVTVRGTAGAKGTFDVDPKLGLGLALVEDAKAPGTYAGSYKVKAGDNVRRRLTAHLVSKDDQEAIAQSAKPVVIDTVAPRILGTFPTSGAALPVSKPNLLVFADDVGGSGLGGGTLTLTVAGNATPLVLTLAVKSDTELSATPPKSLSGAYTAKVVVQDKAGNQTTSSYSFSAGVPSGAIASVSHSAQTAVARGAKIVVEMKATPKGKAFFNLLDDQNRELMADVPLPEAKSGIYGQVYQLDQGQPGQQLKLIGKFKDALGKTTTLLAASPVTVAAPAAVATAVKLAIVAPAAGAKATSPLLVSGTATPGAVVELATKVDGVQKVLIFDVAYHEDLETRQVTADANGRWAAEALVLPAIPKGVTGLKYTLSAVQIVGGKRSDAVTTVVTP